MNWNEIKYPESFAQLPRTEHGIPIPFFVAKIDGKYDLRFADHRKPMICAKRRLCWVCGKPLDYFCAFIGGPISAESLRFADGPMHLECAEFSLRYCPFLSTPNLQYSERSIPSGIAPVTGHSPVKPERHSLTISAGFTIVRVSENEIHFIAGPVQKQTFWKDGSQLKVHDTAQI